MIVETSYYLFLRQVYHKLLPYFKTFLLILSKKQSIPFYYSLFSEEETVNGSSSFIPDREVSVRQIIASYNVAEVSFVRDFELLFVNWDCFKTSIILEIRLTVRYILISLREHRPKAPLGDGSKQLWIGWY